MSEEEQDIIDAWRAGKTETVIQVLSCRLERETFRGRELAGVLQRQTKVMADLINDISDLKMRVLSLEQEFPRRVQ
jgi:hypothetical protein